MKLVYFYIFLDIFLDIRNDLKSSIVLFFFQVLANFEIEKRKLEFQYENVDGTEQL